MKIKNKSIFVFAGCSKSIINDETDTTTCNEGIPGKLGLAERIIDCIVTNSVITKDN